MATPHQPLALLPPLLLSLEQGHRPFIVSLPLFRRVLLQPPSRHPAFEFFLAGEVLLKRARRDGGFSAVGMISVLGWWPLGGDGGSSTPGAGGCEGSVFGWRGRHFDGSGL